MNLLQKIYHKIRAAYWKVASKNSKKAFEEDKRDTYQYIDEVFCSSKESFDRVAKSHAANIDKFWNSQKAFSVGTHFPKTHTEAYKLVFEKYLPLFNEKPCLMDIGCADGEWTLMMAQVCSSIDGYEQSQSLVDTANKNASKTDNAYFYQADARTMQLSKQYDGASILAMLMYISDPNEICLILKNVYNHLKPGAYLCTRDTLNDEGKKMLLMYNIKTGYNAVYWSKDTYYEQFKKSGFVMKEEVLLEEIHNRRLRFIHIGNIWQKPS